MFFLSPTGRKQRILALSISLLALNWSCPGTHAEVFTQGKEADPFQFLKNGEYAWHPEISPTGPVLIIVSIPEQRLFVYRNGVRIGKSTISTGRPGHPTPTGVYTILQKQVEHTSTIYKGAEMPYMERLTWGGIALHAGWLPGHMDSHGCVRLPLEFAKKLYTVTGKGTTVMITDGSATPVTSGHPGYILSAPGDQTAQTDNSDFQWHPEDAPDGPVSIIVSTKSARVYVFRDGVEIGRAVLHGSEDMETGTHAYSALDKLDDEGHRIWNEIDTVGNGPAPEFHELARKLSIAPEFLAGLRTVVQPGTTLVVSDAPTPRAAPIDTDVNILSTTTPNESSKH